MIKITLIAEFRINKFNRQYCEVQENVQSIGF